MYGIFTFLFIFFIIILANAAIAVALTFFVNLGSLHRDRIAAACTVCTSCNAKYRVRTACTSLLITGDQADKMINNCVNF